MPHFNTARLITWHMCMCVHVYILKHIHILHSVLSTFNSPLTLDIHSFSGDPLLFLLGSYHSRIKIPISITCEHCVYKHGPVVSLPYWTPHSESWVFPVSLVHHTFSAP